MESASEKIKALKARRAGMDVEFSDIKPVFEEVRDAVMPMKGRYSLGEKRRGSAINKKIIDSTARRGLRTLSSGLMAGMTSPSRPWFRLGLFNRDAENEPDAKQWLHDVQTTLYDILRASNTYRTLSVTYEDLGLFGVFGGIVVPDYDTVIHTHAFPNGLYRLGENERSEIDTLHYDTRLTVKNVVARYGLENCSDTVQREYKANRLSSMVDICVAIEPRLERDPMSPLATDMPVAQYCWEKNQDKKFLKESGFSTRNILGPRWQQTLGEVYANNWPSLEALGDSLQIQQQLIDKAQAIQMSVKPPMVAGPGMEGTRFRNIPGGVTHLATNDLQKGGIRPAYETRPDVAALAADIQETRDRIRSAYFEDLFLMTAMSDRRQVTATEIAERHEEKLLVLGPVLESMDHGLLQPLINAAFHYAQQADILPEAPESLAGTEIKVEYISLLAQAQKAIGVAAMERTIGFAGTIAQLQPDVIDNFDGDTTLREFVDQVGPPPNMLRDPDKVQDIRTARAEQAQAEQMAASVEPMANAAKLISEANQRGAAGIQRGEAL